MYWKPCGSTGSEISPVFKHHLTPFKDCELDAAVAHFRLCCTSGFALLARSTRQFGLHQTGTLSITMPGLEIKQFPSYGLLSIV
jgi:hypothetical protein